MAVRAAARRRAVHRPLARARAHGAYPVARRGRHRGGRAGGSERLRQARRGARDRARRHGELDLRCRRGRGGNRGAGGGARSPPAREADHCAPRRRGHARRGPDRACGGGGGVPARWAGAALLVAAFAAALGAARRAVRGRAGPGAAAAAAALGAIIYWLVHGSADWFWELPALGTAAFALLGIAAGLAPRGGLRARRPVATGRRAMAAVVAGTLLVGASFGAPALAERLVNRATAIYPHDGQKAFDDL